MCRNSHKNILYDRLSRGGEPDNMRDWFRTKWKDSAREGGGRLSALFHPAQSSLWPHDKYISLLMTIHNAVIWCENLPHFLHGERERERDCFHLAGLLPGVGRARGSRGVQRGRGWSISREQLPEPEIHPHRPLSLLLCNIQAAPAQSAHLTAVCFNAVASADDNWVSCNVISWARHLSCAS